MINDPFQVLGVTSSATEEEIKAAYRKLAKKYHPDLHPGSATAEAKMKEINEAYSEAIKIKKSGGTYTGGYQGSSQSGYQGGFNGFGGFGGFDGFGGFQQEYQRRQSYQTQEKTYADPVMQAAADYLRTGRFTDAMRTLNQVIEHDAAWHALSARANLGLNNRIAALEHARTAVQMEPANAEYQHLLEQLQYTGQAYQRSGIRFGYPNAVCANPFLSCLAINMLGRCLCGRGFFCC